eukprot:g2733.t2
MLRTTLAGVGVTASACRKSAARQAAGTSLTGFRGRQPAPAAVCRREGRRRHWSSQEAEPKEAAPEVGPLRRVNACGDASSSTGEPDAAAAAAAPTPTPTPAPVPAPNPPRHEQEENRRTFVVRTSDSLSPLKVAVPTTTAEAVAMNTSIKEKAKRDAERAAAAASAGKLKPPPRGRKLAAVAAAAGAASSVSAGRRVSSGARKPAAAAAAAAGAAGAGAPAGRTEQPQRAPSVMVVTPNVRSKAIQMKVPRTTAECIELNKAIRERYPGEAQHESVNNSVNANYSRRWRNPPAPAPGAGSGVVGGSGVQWGKPGGVYKDAHGRAAGTVLSSPEMFGYTQLGRSSGEPSFERTIGNLSNGMRWEQIVKVWEEIEEKEKGGEIVKLGPTTYEHLMSAFISHMDLAVVGRCGRVFDHLVASGQDIRPAMYNLYMKGCSVGKLGTRAVALIESLDRLPGKRYQPNPQFFFNLLSATSAEGMVSESKLYYGIMRDRGFEPSNNVYQSLLDMFLREDRLVDALRIVEDTHQAGMKPRDALMNKLTYACMRQGEPELMHKTLDLLLLTSNVVNPLTVKNVLYMATRRRDDDMATKIWVAAEQWGHRFSQADYSFMVQTFFAVGKDDMALATLVQAYKNGIEVSRRTLTFCAQRLAVSNKRLDQAYYTLTLLRDNGEPVPVEAVNAIVVGCAIRQSVDRCFATAEALPVVFDLTPNLDTYNALMHVLGNMRAQDTDNATLGIGMSLLDQIENEGVKPNQETFMSLVDLACMSDGLTEDFANNLVERMTTKHGLRLEQDIVDTLARILFIPL